MRTIYSICLSLCRYYTYSQYNERNYQIEQLFWGLPLDQKKRFIIFFDTILPKIRKNEPEFGKDDFIDRLEPPQIDPNLVGDARDLVNKKIQEKINQEVYWIEHTDEYRSYLEQEKRKEEEKEKNRILDQIWQEINVKKAQLMELEKSINELRKEREKLGILSKGQKKAIDEKTSREELVIINLKNDIQELGKRS